MKTEKNTPKPKVTKTATEAPKKTGKRGRPVGSKNVSKATETTETTKVRAPRASKNTLSLDTMPVTQALQLGLISVMRSELNQINHRIDMANKIIADSRALNPDMKDEAVMSMLFGSHRLNRKTETGLSDRKIPSAKSKSVDGPGRGRKASPESQEKALEKKLRVDGREALNLKAKGPLTNENQEKLNQWITDTKQNMAKAPATPQPAS